MPCSLGPCLAKAPADIGAACLTRGKQIKQAAKYGENQHCKQPSHFEAGFAALIDHMDADTDADCRKKEGNPFGCGCARSDEQEQKRKLNDQKHSNDEAPRHGLADPFMLFHLCRSFLSLVAQARR